MPVELTTRYHDALESLGANRRWYQLGADDYFAAAIAAVDNVAPPEIVERDERLHEVLSARNALHLIRRSLAAVTAARGLDVEEFASASERVAESLRPATRSMRIRRVAGAVTVASGRVEFDVLGNRAVSLYEGWHDRHRMLTTAGDVILAAISQGVGIDTGTALDRAEVASEQLAVAGYKGAWEVARILSIDNPEMSVPRFLGLANVMSGRRSKPLADRRPAIAIAALAPLPRDELQELISHRLQAARITRWRPDARTALSIAALITLGGSLPSTHRLYPAFHGFVLRQHYLASFHEANNA